MESLWFLLKLECKNYLKIQEVFLKFKVILSAVDLEISEYIPNYIENIIFSNFNFNCFQINEQIWKNVITGFGGSKNFSVF